MYKKMLMRSRSALEGRRKADVTICESSMKVECSLEDEQLLIPCRSEPHFHFHNSKPCQAMRREVRSSKWSWVHIAGRHSHSGCPDSAGGDCECVEDVDDQCIGARQTHVMFSKVSVVPFPKAEGAMKLFLGK